MNATDQPTNGQPTDEELRFLKKMGMTGIEPGRWSSAWQGSGPESKDWSEDFGSERQEQLDLLVRAGRVQNEFDLEQSGSRVAADVQLITEGPLADMPQFGDDDHTEVDLAVFVAIKESSAGDFDGLTGGTISVTLDQVREEYPCYHRQMQSPSPFAGSVSRARPSASMPTPPVRTKAPILATTPASAQC